MKEVSAIWCNAQISALMQNIIESFAFNKVNEGRKEAVSGVMR